MKMKSNNTNSACLAVLLACFALIPFKIRKGVFAFGCGYNKRVIVSKRLPLHLMTRAFAASIFSFLFDWLARLSELLLVEIKPDSAPLFNSSYMSFIEQAENSVIFRLTRCR